MKSRITTIAAFTLLIPVTAFAALTETKKFIEAAGDIVRLLTILAASIALLVFFYGLAKFIFRVGGDEKAVDEGKRIMGWGLVALFVMLSVWGIVGLMQSELGLPNTVDDADKVKAPAIKYLYDQPGIYD